MKNRFYYGKIVPENRDCPVTFTRRLLLISSAWYGLCYTWKCPFMALHT